MECFTYGRKLPTARCRTRCEVEELSPSCLNRQPSSHDMNGTTLSVQPFEPTVSDERLEELREILAQEESRFTMPPGSEFQGSRPSFGMTSERFSHLLTSWVSFLDKNQGAEHDTLASWLAYLRTFSHYTAKIEDIPSLHFIREQPDAETRRSRKVIPLLLLHGWPGSILEFLQVIKPLAHPGPNVPANIPAFDVISPSHPGYLWSSLPTSLQKASKVGTTAGHTGPEGDFRREDVARVMDKLMVGLGFGSGYAVQAGDWGTGVLNIMAHTYPTRVKAVHLNFAPNPPPLLTLGKPLELLLSPLNQLVKTVLPRWISSIPETIAELPRAVPRQWYLHKPNALTWLAWRTASLLFGLSKPLSSRDQQNVQRGLTFMSDGSAYNFFHATRPSTLALLSSASPLVILAWIGEKFDAWSDVTPSDSEILASLTLWWLTDTMPRSIYPYRNRAGGRYPSLNIPCPAGHSATPYELIPTPKDWLAPSVNLKWFREHSSGGHFFALECPDAFIDDIQTCFAAIYPA